MPKHNNQTIFYNADYIVVEYMDLIKNPYLTVINTARNNQKLDNVFDLNALKTYSNVALLEWYLTRKHINPFMNLSCKLDLDDIKREIFCDGLLKEHLNFSDRFYTSTMELPLIESLITMKSSKISNDIIIYHPYDNDFAKKDLKQLTGHDFTFMTDFNEVMDTAGANSTYILSDINHIDEMKEKGILAYSSITLPVEYRYNKKNMTDMRIDFEGLFKDNPFKLSYCRAYPIEK